ncbi:hypothetical protein [Nonomuraea sp. SYSU D8015]|uniref:hypothetical protein n=1 Tax=Nonomuraea sp. SYSU D8015 TaxID=2593644 RepID=UPI00166109EE|nr:hypothetical protein [Nonomuraea sp. SYSU D8015]
MNSFLPSYLTPPAAEPTVEVNIVIKDWRGRDITVGSKVLYASEYGSSYSMVEGEVTKIVTRKGWSWESDKTVTKVTVKPERRSRGNGRYYQADTVTISRIENLTVVG